MTGLIQCWSFYLRLFLIPLHYGGVGGVVHDDPDLHARKRQAHRTCGKPEPDADLKPQWEQYQVDSDATKLNQ